MLWLELATETSKRCNKRLNGDNLREISLKLEALKSINANERTSGAIVWVKAEMCTWCAFESELITLS